jgi:hypothetical protein
VIRRSYTMAFLKPTLVSALLAALLLLAVLLLGIFLPQNTPRAVLNQQQAVRSIRDLSLAEHTYALQHPDAGFACDLRELGEQGVGPPAGLIDRVLASGTKSSYHFEIGCAQGESQKATAYTITAVPTKPGTTGVYALCTDQSGEIWYSENGSPSDCLAKRKPIEQKHR